MAVSKSKPIKIGIVGVGKIVRDQHLPALAKNPDFRLVATASRHGTVEGVQSFATIEAMLDAVHELDAVSLCMPPQFRYDAARQALEAGKHVFLEKPPGATVSEVEDLKRWPRSQGCRRCLPAGIRAMRRRSRPRVPFWLEPRSNPPPSSGRKTSAAGIPNQDWIWQAGGFGVFDPGINALSIATHILPRRSSSPRPCSTFPRTAHAPIARRIASALPTGRRSRWTSTGARPARKAGTSSPRRTAGRWCSSGGGAKLAIDGKLRARRAGGRISAALPALRRNRRGRHLRCRPRAAAPRRRRLHARQAQIVERSRLRARGAPSMLVQITGMTAATEVYRGGASRRDPTLNPSPQVGGRHWLMFPCSGCILAVARGKQARRRRPPLPWGTGRMDIGWGSGTKKAASRLRAEPSLPRKNELAEPSR